jgi:hypothetical protein
MFITYPMDHSMHKMHYTVRRHHITNVQSGHSTMFQFDHRLIGGSQSQSFHTVVHRTEAWDIYRVHTQTT